MAHNNNISGHVQALADAFSNGLEVLKSLRERTRTKGRKVKVRDGGAVGGAKSKPRLKPQPGPLLGAARSASKDRRPSYSPTSSHGINWQTTAGQRKRGGSDGNSDKCAELRLSTSLRRGPGEIRRNYEYCRGRLGGRFTAGDVMAKASLTETLLKLNTGLVEIISSFLNGGKKKLEPDFDKLTTTSEEAKTETINALFDLFVRLSVPEVPREQLSDAKHQPPVATNRKAGEEFGKKTRKHTKASGARRKNISIKSVSVAKVSLSGSAGKQLAIVRPRDQRKSSTSSLSSSSKAAPVSKPTSTQQEPQRLPTAALMPSQQTPAVDSAEPNIHRYRKDSVLSTQAEEQIHESAQDRKGSSASPRQPSVAPAVSRPPPVAQPEQLFPRRPSKSTPSAYSMLSGTTKLGEIPPHKQVNPPDLELMDTLNAEAAAAALEDFPPGAHVPAKARGKAGFRFPGRSWKFWKGRAVTAQ